MTHSNIESVIDAIRQGDASSRRDLDGAALDEAIARGEVVEFRRCVYIAGTRAAKMAAARDGWSSSGKVVLRTLDDTTTEWPTLRSEEPGLVMDREAEELACAVVQHYATRRESLDVEGLAGGLCLIAACDLASSSRIPVTMRADIPAVMHPVMVGMGWSEDEPGMWTFAPRE